MSLVFYSSFVPSYNEVNALCICKEFLNYYNIHFSDSPLYIGIQHGSSNKWIDHVAQLSANNKNIKYNIVNPELNNKSDVAGFQSALHKFYLDPVPYDGHVWFGHSKGATSHNYKLADSIVSNFWPRRIEIENRINAEPSVGSYGIYITLLKKIYGENILNIWSQLIDNTELDLNPGYNFFHPFTFFTLRKEVFNIFIKKVNVQKFFKDKLLGGDLYFFERDFVHISDIMGFKPIYDIVTANTSWKKINQHEFKQNYNEWIQKYGK